MGSFDFGVTLAHRSEVEILGDNGIARIEDLSGGSGRSGNFEAY